MSEVLLRLEGVGKVYRPRSSPDPLRALNNVDLSVCRGEFIMVIGPSGSGKTSLLHCIGRVTKPSTGKIWWRDQEIQNLEGRALRAARRSIAMIFQHFNLVPRLSVLTNVWTGRLGYLSFWQSLRRKTTDLDLARVCLKRVGLEKKAFARADQLSGGQGQRVAIARALCQAPDLLLADEPVASLDPPLAREIIRDLATASREFGITVICNLHDLALMREFATRVIGLRDGQIVFDGLPEQVDEAQIVRIYGSSVGKSASQSVGVSAAKFATGIPGRGSDHA